MSGLRHLIVVVPGIGGSVLAGPDGRSVWDLRPGALVRDVIDPEHLAIDRELTPTRLVDDLAVLRPWLVIPGYGALTRLLRRSSGPGCAWSTTATVPRCRPRSMCCGCPMTSGARWSSPRTCWVGR